jgi:putative DNA primase/helicase
MNANELNIATPVSSDEAQQEQPRKVAARKLAHARTNKASDSGPGGFTTNTNGVFYADDEGKKHWICSPLQIVAAARDSSSENWGRLIEFTDPDGQGHSWAMPMELLRGSGDELKGELLRLGVSIAPGRTAHTKLLEYIITARTTTRARCVHRTGWFEKVFVLPERTIGPISELVIYQGNRHDRYYTQSGTLESWRHNVAALCVGNPRLVLACASAFAAMLLFLCGGESGGLHFVGDSSCGKTTGLRISASVFGPPKYLQSWRATDNGLEALAALHNDTLLILDELGQIDPWVAGEIAYLLANGSGKQRAGRTGGARARQSWRLLFLSAGEIGLAQHMREAGKKARAGQEVRLVDVPADAGSGFGIFDTLHGFDSGAALSDRITEATASDYGTPAVAFLERITTPETLGLLPKTLKTLCQQFVEQYLPKGASGQVHRVCQRFALIAVAGEIATEFGITGWVPGAAENAVATCFRAWLDHRGGSGNQERAAILGQVKAFFEAHGDSRFAPWRDDGGKTINRVGFKEKLESGPVYYVLPEIYKKEICAGYEPKAVTKVLLEAGWLKVDTTGVPQCREHLPGMGRTRCYIFLPAMWEA